MTRPTEPRALHVRLLAPADGALPPLISPRVDERIYRLVALALRAHVLSWYPRLTHDTTLLPALTPLVLSALVPLLRAAPGAAPRLLLSDLPALLALHVRTVRAADDAVAVGLYETRAEAYHAMLPVRGVARLPVAGPPGPPTADMTETTTPASAGDVLSDAELSAALADATTDVRPTPPAEAEVGPETALALDPAYFAAAAHAVLVRHLGPADAASAAQTAIAHDVLGRLVLCGVGRKLGQPWFWWQLALRFLPPACGGRGQDGRDGPGAGSGKEEAREAAITPRPRPLDRARALIDVGIRLGMRMWAAALVLWSALAYALACPPSGHTAVLDPWLAFVRLVARPTTLPARLAFGALDALAAIGGGLVDRVVPALLDRHLNEDTAVNVLGLVERIVFPDGWPSPSPPDPSDDEAARMRRDVVVRLEARVPRWAQDAFFPAPHVVEDESPTNARAGDTADLVLDGSRDEAAVAPRDRAASAGVAGLVDWLDDAQCNAHLVAMFYTAALGALVPSLVVPAGGKAR